MLFWLLACITILLFVILCDHVVLRRRRRELQEFEGLVGDLCDCIKNNHGVAAKREALLIAEVASGQWQTQIARFGGEVTQKKREAWKSFAVALEAFCDAITDGDVTGAINAAKEVASRRSQLQVLGEYDA